MNITPYLQFNGNCEEAIHFYAQVFKTEVGEIMRMGDQPDQVSIPEAARSRVMHTHLEIGDTLINASDTMEGYGPPFVQGNNVQVAVDADSREEADRIFSELSAGGKVIMPMEDMFFGYFGSLLDKFGVTWMLIYNEKPTF